MEGALDGGRVLLGGEPPRCHGAGHGAGDHVLDHAAAPRHGAQPDDRQGEPEAAELALLLREPRADTKKPSQEKQTGARVREGQGREGTKAEYHKNKRCTC